MLGAEIMAHWREALAHPWRLLAYLGVIVLGAGLLVWVDDLPNPWRRRIADWGMWCLALFFVAATPVLLFILVKFGIKLWHDGERGIVFSLILPGLMLLFLTGAFLRMAWRREVK